MNHTPGPNEAATRKGTLAMILALPFLLAFLIAGSPRHLCYDEQDHLGLTRLIQQTGLRPALVSPEDRSGAGPLFPAVQLAFSPLTGLRPPGIRWVNFGCLLLVMFLLAKQTRRSSLQSGWVAAGSITAIPFLWPASGLALTEVPALAAFTAFFLLALELLATPNATSGRAVLRAVLAGICLGAAILGRQPYLAVIPVLLAMIGWVPGKWLPLSLCALVASLSSGWLFVWWGGLSPPCYQQIAHSGISLPNGILALSYAGAATLFLNPGWMKPGGKWESVLGAVLGVLAASVARDYSMPPAKSVLLRLFGEGPGLFAGFLLGVAIAMLGVVWLWHLLIKIWGARANPAALFPLLTLAALVATPVKMTAQFSSRYVVGLLGVLLLVVTPLPVTRWWWGRMLSGGLVGAAMLWTYYHSPLR